MKDGGLFQNGGGGGCREGAKIKIFQKDQKDQKNNKVLSSTVHAGEDFNAELARTSAPFGTTNRDERFKKMHFRLRQFVTAIDDIRMALKKVQEGILMPPSPPESPVK